MGAERVIYLKENNMKRMSKTAIALATAGALGFAVVPMADAQTERPTHQTAAPSDNDLTAIPNANGEEFVEDNAPTEGANPESTTPLPGTERPGHNIKVEDSAPAGVTVEEAVKGENPYPGASQPLPSGLTEQPGPTFRNGQPITKKEGDKTLVLFEDKDKVQTYFEVNEKGEPIVNGKVVSGQRPATVVREPGATTEKDALPIVLGVLGGLAGLGLVIAGVNYWVNKDGNLVTDPNKVNEPSSPADAENTKKIVAENTDEVAKQLGIDPATGQPVNNGQATGGERGIGAATGVNKIPAALLSLLLASVLGAAAFVFGRRQLV